MHLMDERFAVFRVVELAVVENLAGNQFKAVRIAVPPKIDLPYIRIPHDGLDSLVTGFWIKGEVLPTLR